MARRVILDTHQLIDYERGRVDQATLDDDDLARAFAVIAENVEVLDYTQATAAQHARLIAPTRRSGRPRGAHDLIIAAHAAESDRVLLSGDASARFGDLPGVIAETSLVTRSRRRRPVRGRRGPLVGRP